jgi:hypothetical protein
MPLLPLLLPPSHLLLPAHLPLKQVIKELAAAEGRPLLVAAASQVLRMAGVKAGANLAGM